MDLPYITFFSDKNIAQFFQYVGALLYIVMPILLIMAATLLAGHLIRTVKGVFSRKEENYDVKAEVKDVKY